MFGIPEVLLLRWVHILCMVYWLGGEWGIFQTSYNIVNAKLSMEERRRHLETAYRIDILARTGIILLLPLGLHMGNFYGLQPFGGGWLVLMWVVTLAWVSLTWSAFLKRETDLGITLTKIDEALRYILIPVIFIITLTSLAGYGPFVASTGTRWYIAKFGLYGLTLCIGLFLRFVMRRWTVMFRELANGPNPEIEAALERESGQARMIAYFYWITIAGICFLGAAKPF